MQYLVMIFVLSILIVSGKLFTVGGAFAAISIAFVILKEKEAGEVCVMVSALEIVHAIA